MLLLLLACAHHIADPGPLNPAPDSPAATPELKVCWVEFSRGNLPHGLVVARGLVEEDLESTASGLLLVHPRGSWLIDGGPVTDLERELSEVRGLPRLLLKQSAKSWERVSSPVDALAALGVEASSLTGAIPTHGHYDHLGGLLELEHVPIVLPQAEIDLAAASTERGDVILAPEARALLPRAKPAPFEPEALLLWPERWDLFGDNSAVVFPMPGHTPGSVGARVVLPDGRRLLLVGDTVWVREGYEHREPKSWLAGAFDSDQEQNDLQIARLHALHQADPGLVILPAHDRRVWVKLFGQPGCLGG